MAYVYEAGLGKEQEEKPEEIVDVKIGIFFDGTLNNMANTDARKLVMEDRKAFQDAMKKGTIPPKRKATDDQRKAFQKSEDDPTASYYNDYSNVGRLYEFYDESFRIYVEGIGTENEKEDNQMGYAFGSGGTGITWKVRKGCEWIAENAKSLAKNKKIHTLTLDVFGFSRGAAAARHFVYEVTQPEKSGLPAYGILGEELQKPGKIEVQNLVIRFLGIYDTVSSFARGFTSYTLAAKHSIQNQFRNNENLLHLHAINNKVERIVHFTADDEHRSNFALTRIHELNQDRDFANDSCNIAIEKNFPGVHCDIGGAYNPEEDEAAILDYTRYSSSGLLEERKKLLDEYWYQPHQLTVSPWTSTMSLFLENATIASYVLVGRRRISNKYSFVFLHYMCELAKSYKKSLPFQQGRLKMKYNLEDENHKLRDIRGISESRETHVSATFIQDVKTRLENYVLKNGRELKKMTGDEFEERYLRVKTNPDQHDKFVKKCIEDLTMIKILRRHYIHWSSGYHMLGMNPNRPNDAREREIYKGNDNPNFVDIDGEAVKQLERAKYKASSKLFSLWKAIKKT